MLSSKKDSNFKKFKIILKKSISSPSKNIFPKLINNHCKLLYSSSSCKQIKYSKEKKYKHSSSHKSMKDLFNAKKVDSGLVTDRLIKINRNSDSSLLRSQLSTTYALKNSYESYKPYESMSKKSSSKIELYSGNETKNSSSMNKSTIKTLNRVNSSIELNLHSTCEDEQNENEEELHFQFVKLFQKKKQFYNNLSSKLNESNNVLNYNDYYAL